MSDTDGFQRLLSLLGRDGESIRIARGRGDDFGTAPIPADQITPALAHLDANGFNAWFELNPSSFNRTEGRSRAGDITRLAAVYADIDFKDKPKGMGTLPEAMDLLRDLEGALGVPAAAVVQSGHGIQPYWPIADGHITEENRDEIASTLKRWGLLVQQLAAANGGYADNVFDLPRILRVPGPANVKDPRNPVPTAIAFQDGNTPLEMAFINQVLDDYEIPLVEVETSQEVVSAMDGWDWAEEDCHFVAMATREIETSVPASRHHWALKWAAIIHGMIRGGCLTEAGFYQIRSTLLARFEWLLANEGTPRPASPGEFNAVFRTGKLKAESWSEHKLADELRQHTHAFDFGPADVQVTAQSLESNQPGSSPAVTNVSSIFTGQPLQATTPAAGPMTMGALALDVEVRSQQRMLQAGFTDTGNAEKLAHHLRGTYIWVALIGWHEWDGNRYVLDTEGRVMEATKDMFIQMLANAPDDAHRKWAHASLSKGRMQSALELCKSVPFLVVSPALLDAKPYEINTPGGIVDLHTGQLRPANPLHDFHTFTTDVTPASAPMPKFIQFLLWAIGDMARVTYLQRLFGAALIGELRWHIFPIFLGVGANGKTTLLEIMVGVFGQYGTVMPQKFLIETNGNNHPTEIAQLRGVRLAVIPEVPPTARFDEDLIKTLTGETRLRARYMNKDFFTFQNTCTPFLSGNHLPAVRVGGQGFWRRVRKIDFENQMPLVQQNPNLVREILAEESAAILQWVIEGAADVLKNGLRDPEKVLTATRQYQLEEDTMARFMEDTLVVSEGLEVRREAVYDIYKQWVIRQGGNPLPFIKFAREITMIRPDTNLSTRDYFSNTSLVRYQVTYADEELA